mmetsp:Transcript_25593/g.59433  ORF Transcript_25593/g.59433 Transcript_25593/m.59433 type:complete len:145 (-) Transcript_25593:1646-2080(-)
MKRNFLTCRDFIEREFPELKGKVTGENYPTAPIIELLQQILQGVQLLTMALIIFGDSLWTVILRFSRVPQWYYPLKDHGYQVCFAIFYLLPQLLGRFIISGAFEVYIDEELVFSKLESGRMPEENDIIFPLKQRGLVPLSPKYQ